MCGYGISFNTRYVNEVKIHAGHCRHTRNASQVGEVKWEFSEELGNAVLIANKHCNDKNQWRYAQCCLRKAKYVYKCRNCDKLTTGKRIYNKFILATLLIIGLSIWFVPMAFAQLGPNYDPIFYDVMIYVMTVPILWFIVAAIYYFAHPLKCPKCKTKNYK